MAKRVGILGYQGCIQPHISLLNKLGAESIIVSRREQLEQIDCLILPGGESSTMLKFIESQALSSDLVAFGKTHPVWGICAGAILIAREVQSPVQKSLGLIDIRATRNYYGSQLDSFTQRIKMQILDGKEMPCHFIRAPLLTAHEASTSSQTKLHVLASVEQQPVFFAQGTVWACSFHVELGSDPSLHEAFLGL